MIYILEDDESIRTMLSYALLKEDESQGFERPGAFWQAMEEEIPQIIVLDLMLPEEDGLSILKKLKASEAWEDIPVLILSAKDSEVDKAIGLDLGADDYLAKPFGIIELTSRVKAIKRRYEKTKKKDRILKRGTIELNESKHEVTKDGASVELSYKEYNLLKVLLEADGCVVKREELLEKVWGPFYEESRTLDVHIRKLRQKLDLSKDEIRTIKNVGYCLAE